LMMLFFILSKNQQRDEKRREEKRREEEREEREQEEREEEWMRDQGERWQDRMKFEECDVTAERW
jgi:hypothetical protein